MQIVSFDMWITQFQIFVYILLLSVKILGFVYLKLFSVHRNCIPFRNFTEIFKNFCGSNLHFALFDKKIVKTHPCELEELVKMEVWRKLNVSQTTIFLHSTAQSSILDTVIELRYVKCLYPVRTRSKHPVYINYFSHLFK